MVVSTMYDPILGEKVFVIRGAERYTHSTITSLSLDYAANRRSGFSVTFTATVQHHKSNSSVAFYDGDEILGIVNIKSSQSTVTFTTRVPYGYHKFYAKYLGNDECLSSKSAIQELTVTEPDLPTPIISFYGYNEEIFTTSLDFYASLIHNAAGLTGKTVKLYIDEALDSTITLNGATHITNEHILTPGQHTVKIVFDGDDAYLGAEREANLYVGYDVTADVDYTKVAVGEEIIVHGHVHKWTGEPVSGRTLTVERD